MFTQKKNMKEINLWGINCKTKIFILNKAQPQARFNTNQKLKQVS